MLASWVAAEAMGWLVPAGKKCLLLGLRLCAWLCARPGRCPRLPILPLMTKALHPARGGELPPRKKQPASKKWHGPQGDGHGREPGNRERGAGRTPPPPPLTVHRVKGEWELLLPVPSLPVTVPWTHPEVSTRSRSHVTGVGLLGARGGDVELELTS